MTYSYWFVETQYSSWVWTSIPKGNWTWRLKCCSRYFHSSRMYGGLKILLPWIILQRLLSATLFKSFLFLYLPHFQTHQLKIPYYNRFHHHYSHFERLCLSPRSFKKYHQQSSYQLPSFILCPCQYSEVLPHWCVGGDHNLWDGLCQHCHRQLDRFQFFLISSESTTQHYWSSICHISWTGKLLKYIFW